MCEYVCISVFFFFFLLVTPSPNFFADEKNSILDWRKKNPINKFNEKLITFFIYWKFYDVSDETGSFGKITIFHPINIPHSVLHHQVFKVVKVKGGGGCKGGGGLFL